MRRVAVVLCGLLALVIVASQLALPGIAERRAESRLERNGGTARVSLSALPAARLLLGDGDSLTVKGSGLDLTPEQRRDALERIDGFDEVSVKLDRLVAGPLDVSSFTMKRGEGEHDFRTRMRATTRQPRSDASSAPRRAAPSAACSAGWPAAAFPEVRRRFRLIWAR